MPAKEIIDGLHKSFLEQFNSGNSNLDEALDYYTDDAVYMAPGLKTVRGKADLKKAFEQYMKNKGHTSSSKMELNCTDAHEAGDVLIAVGEYKMSADGKNTEEGKYVSVYKQENGKWKAFIDIFSN